MSVPIENPYANSYWLMPAHITYRFKVIADYCSNFGQKTVTLRFWGSFSID